MGKNKSLPGELGLWIFLLGDLMLFGLYFVLFVYDRGMDRQSFYLGQAALDGGIGLLNTVLLLTGSWAVVMGTRVERDARRAAHYLAAAALSGLIFLVLKTLEYTHLVDAGRYLTESRFFVWYFFLTGYHAVHVMAGSLFLVVLAVRLYKNSVPGERLMEAGGCYWHLVDLLWIGIFTIAYLL